jgi:hypothetical protein
VGISNHGIFGHKKAQKIDLLSGELSRAPIGAMVTSPKPPEILCLFVAKNSGVLKIPD